MLKVAIKKLFGSQNERELKRIWPLVTQINEFEESISGLTDGELAAKTSYFKEQLSQGRTLNEILPEAFAVVREASKRVLNMRHFDVQMIGGVVLHEGKIAEMKTGEGKTLVATLPVYLNALSGEGVHVVTVNDYLAKRDAEWMGAVYNFLGMDVGVVLGGMSYAEKRAAYLADITYGQNNEFGFDYLRDNMKIELEEMVQRSYNFAIVDEVDSILIDEARTPLIISGPVEEATEVYLVANQVAKQLVAEEDYSVELKTKQVTLTDEGVAKVEKILGIDNLYDVQNIAIVHHVNQALKAHVTMKRDVDYVVRGGQVIIVDEFTGRLMAGRRWSDGLHQAVEAKEGVRIAQENQTLATVTFQNYFRMYEKLAGMTGTADTEAVEFKKIYNLDVVVIPTNRPIRRKDYSDIVFSSEAGKIKAVCEEIAKLNEKGQPVLVGTASIAKSEQLHSQLKKRGVPHNILNAKHHEKEADIVAQAGRIGSVTISTNMAGRGTDIVLGGNPEFLAAAAGDFPKDSPEYLEILEEARRNCEEEREQVLAVGGLHILGTERHESRRIDNQLRGRSGRQGDPGSSRFYVSLADDLMKRFGGERMQSLMSRVGLQEDDALEGSLVGRAVENAQKKVEAHHFDIRKHLLEYDDVMNKQREVVYSLRDRVLKGEGLKEDLEETIGDVAEETILSFVDEKEAVSEWPIEDVLAESQRIFGLTLDATPYLKIAEAGGPSLAQQLFDALQKEAMERLLERERYVGQESFQQFTRIIYLQVIDYLWKEHLANMDHLKEGIGLRGWGQKDPLREYQREAYQLFEEMVSAIKITLLQNIFTAELPSAEEIAHREEQEREAKKKQEQAAKTVHQEFADDPEVNTGNRDDLSEQGVNRQDRRQREQYKRQVEPVTVNMSISSGSARDKKRKKRKDKKQARKKNR